MEMLELLLQMQRETATHLGDLGDMMADLRLKMNPSRRWAALAGAPAMQGNGADPESLHRYLEAQATHEAAEIAWIWSGLPLAGDAFNKMQRAYDALTRARAQWHAVAGVTTPE